MSKIKKQVQQELNEESVQAQIIPETGKEKLVHVIVAVVIIAVVGTAVLFGGRFALFCSKMSKLEKLVAETVRNDTGEFEANVTYGAREFLMSGSFEKSGGNTQLLCEIDYGDRTSELIVNTSGDNAYIYIESDVEETYMSVDIGALRYMMGEKNSSFEWESLLASTSDVSLSEYYDADKLDTAAKEFRETLTKPSELYSMMSCKTKDDKYVVTIDTYKLFMTLAECAKPAFKTEDAYDRLLETIQGDKDALKAESIEVTLTEKDEKLTAVSIAIGGESPVNAEVELPVTDDVTTSDFEMSTELCRAVTLDVACVRIMRAGLDTDAAYKEASMCINAFQERYSHEILSGTVVEVTDTSANSFQFVYSQDNKLETVEYGDDMFNIRQEGGYVQLDTTNMDTGAYTVAMYEPASGKSSDTDNYNNAYLAAIQGFRAITSAGYEMTEDAIFVVTEGGGEFQFVYQDGNLFDVYEQYYYIVNESYGIADMGAVQGIPENVKLYIPNTNTSDK